MKMEINLSYYINQRVWVHIFYLPFHIKKNKNAFSRLNMVPDTILSFVNQAIRRFVRN